MYKRQYLYTALILVFMSQGGATAQEKKSGFLDKVKTCLLYTSGVVAHHFDGIFQGFAFRRTRCFGVTKPDYTGSQAVGCCFKTESCAGRWLEKEGGNHFPFQQPTVGTGFKLLRHREHVDDFFLAMLGNGD